MKKGSEKKPGNEEKMYPVVRDYLSRVKGCKQVFINTLESSEKRIHLLRGLCIRDPDIVAIHDNGRIFIAEVKLLIRSGKAFEECMAQLESLRLFGDFFYAVFPKSDWEKLKPRDVDHYKDILHEKGFGLLLVDQPNDCDEEITPQLNKKNDESKQAILRRHFSDENDLFIPRIDTISSQDAKIAGLSFVVLTILVDKTIKQIIQKIFKTKVTDSQMPYNFRTPANDEIDSLEKIIPQVLGTYTPVETIAIETDPLGYYVGDGRPCIWIEVEIDDIKTWEKAFSKKAKQNWDYVFFSKEDQDRIVPISEFKNAGHMGEIGDINCWLLHKVDCFGRTLGSLKEEITEALETAENIVGRPK